MLVSEHTNLYSQAAWCIMGVWRGYLGQIARCRGAFWEYDDVTTPEILNRTNSVRLQTHIQHRDLLWGVYSLTKMLSYLINVERKPE